MRKLYDLLGCWFADPDYLSGRYSVDSNPDAIALLCSVHHRVLPERASEPAAAAAAAVAK